MSVKERSTMPHWTSVRHSRQACALILGTSPLPPRPISPAPTISRPHPGAWDVAAEHVWPAGQFADEAAFAVALAGIWPHRGQHHLRRHRRGDERPTGARGAAERCARPDEPSALPTCLPHHLPAHVFPCLRPPLPSPSLPASLCPCPSSARPSLLTSLLPTSLPARVLPSLALTLPVFRLVHGVHIRWHVSLLVQACLSA
eukprot:358186-Chlamydomonas_euryale.AAC.3